MQQKYLFLSFFILFLSIKPSYAQVVSPYNLQALLFENTSIKISWADTSSTKTGFLLESSIGSTEKWSLVDTLSSNATEYILSPITDGSIYYFRVCTIYDSVKSDYSNIVSAEIPLFAPTTLSAASPNSSQIDLAWEDKSNNEVGYRVERRVGDLGTWILISNLPPNTTSFPDLQLVDGTKYFYRVSAFSTDTTSQFSNEAELFIPISDPTALSFSVITNDQISLNWLDNSKSENVYLLQQKIGSAGNFISIAELGPNSINYSVANLVADSTYYFKVFCFNAADTSNYSNEVRYSVPAIQVIAETEELPSPFTFNVDFNLGITFSDRSTHNVDKENLEWLLGTHLFFSYLGESFQLDTDLFFQYGQLVAKGMLPEKTQDYIILNFMPSIKLMSSPTVRLFLQTKAESQVAKGYIDDQETKFADPMFLTHTLFLGNKNQIITLSEELNFKVVYGLGYSFQQIIKNNFQLISEVQNNSNVDFLDGPSAVFNVLFTKAFGETINTSISLNTILMAKKNFFKDTENSRFSSLLVANLNIDLFSIKYTNRLIYDSEISTKRQLDQSIVFSLQLSF